MDGKEIRHLEDDIYQLVVTDTDHVEHQGTLVEIEAYIKLRERGFYI